MRYANPETTAKFTVEFKQELVDKGVFGVGLSRTDISHFMHLALVDNPDTVAAVLRSSEPKNPYFYALLVPWIGEGLLVSNGMKWARNRRLLTPAFHYEILKGYASVYGSAVSVLVEKWRARILDADHTTSIRVNVSKDVPLLTLDVILQCAMSYESDCQIQPNKYTDAVMALVKLVQLRGLNIFMHPSIIYYLTKEGREFRAACDLVHQYSERIIKERQHKLSLPETDAGRPDSILSECVKKDFLHILLTAKDADGAGLSFQEVQSEVDTFLFEGHDTTASALQWALYFLAGHPDVQARCRNEAQQVSSSHGLAAGDVTYESLQELSYIEQVLKETMRVATTVPLIHRRLTSDITINGYLLPSGAWVVANLFSLHNNPVIWPDPMKFDPSRFDTTADNESKPPFAFVPFSGGPRNCIGQNLAMEEMKSAVSLILQEFQLSLPEDMHDVQQHLYVVNRPSKPIEVIVKPLME